MSRGTIAWESDPMPSDLGAEEWRHRLKGSRLKPGVVALAIRRTSGTWHGEINGEQIDRGHHSQRSTFTAVERVLLRKGWLTPGKWTAQAEYDRTAAEALRSEQNMIARWAK